MASNVKNSSLHKNQSVKSIKTLNELQNVETIASILSKGRNLLTDDQPTFVLLVGSPGVGKTTQIKKHIKHYTKKDYDDFYHVSLDSIIERIEPYREVTKQLYDTIAERREKNKSEIPLLINENYANLSNVYLPTVTSKKSNFGLTQKYKVSLEKITKRLNDEERKQKIKNLEEEHKNNSKEENKQVSENKLEEDHKTHENKKNTNKSEDEHKQNIKKSEEDHKENIILTKRTLNNSKKIRKPTTKKPSKTKKNNNQNNKSQDLKKLTDLLNDGLKYGIEHNYNIIYDTTFDGTMKKLSNLVLPMLEEHAKKTEIKYKIFVVLVKPDIQFRKVNNTLKHKVIPPRNVIYERLMGRHENMIKSGYIRAINPKLIKTFIDQNKDGYNEAKKYIMDDKIYDTEKGKLYNHNDFKFIPIRN